MKKTTQKTRGRKASSRGKILTNGLYDSQWERIQEDAQLRNTTAAVLLREIVDWYYASKERLQGDYAQQSEFEKLPNKNKEQE